MSTTWPPTGQGFRVLGLSKHVFKIQNIKSQLSRTQGLEPLLAKQMEDEDRKVRHLRGEITYLKVIANIHGNNVSSVLSVQGSWTLDAVKEAFLTKHKV